MKLFSGICALFFLFSQGAFAASVSQTVYTFVPNSLAYNYALTLPARGLYKVSAAVQASQTQCGSSVAGTWSISAVTFMAQDLGGYPASVTTSPVSEPALSANTDNGCSTSIAFSGLTNGEVNLAVTNANGATVTVTVTTLLTY
jgi:hypothetical protein